VIDFDPETHSYTLDGQPVPSVTQILSAMGFIDSSWFTDYARERGKLVHRIIHWHITGELDEDTIDDALRGYFTAWLAFEKDTGFVSKETEVPLGNAAHRFAGTPDHIGILNKEAVIDCKSGVIAPWAGLQLAAYEILHGEPLKRYALQLKDDGKYSLKEFKDRQDRGVFLAALACFHWQKNNGRKA
jgi:hypothetical protein